MHASGAAPLLIEATPAALAAAWETAMRRGDFGAAWEVSDEVLRRQAGQTSHHLPRHQQWIWDGRPLAGHRVLVRCYHGLGDTVQFIRYAPQLKAIAREVIVWAQPSLVELLRTARGIDRVLPLHDGAPAVDYDADIEVMELPHFFRTTVDTIPADVPYLFAPRDPPNSSVIRSLPEGVAVQVPGQEERVVDRNADSVIRSLSKPLRVGIVWQVSDWARHRSVPISELAPLARVPGVQWHLLQRGPARREWLFPGAVDVSADDVVITAGAMRSLDLMISVDSFPTHLSGALGVPTWTLLHAQADWRWMDERADSPWYPSMRLFRQREPGTWRELIARVTRELAWLVAGRGG